MGTNSRRPIYLSKTKDKDILDYIRPLLEQYTFSSVIRELVRDGIKYREEPQSVQTPYQKVVHNKSKALSSSLGDIKLETKTVSEQDLEHRLDNF